MRILGIESAPDERPGAPAGDRDAAGAASPDAGRSFASRPLWQRLVIVFAGPAANLVLPVIIYFVFFDGLTALPAAVIGDVLEGGVAARAGLEPGDRVLENDGRAVRYWKEIEDTVRSSPGRELRLRVARGGKVFERYLTPLEETVRSRDGGLSVQGRVGITNAPFVPIVVVIDAGSPAARAGLRAPATSSSASTASRHGVRRKRGQCIIWGSRDAPFGGPVTRHLGDLARIDESARSGKRRSTGKRAH